MASLFRPEFGLVFWMLIVFLIILGILAKYAWPVIIRSIEARAVYIDNGVKYTQDAIKQLEEAKDKARMILEEAHKQQLESLQETERMKQSMLEDAKKVAKLEAHKIIEDARLSIEQARRESEARMREEISRLSLEVASKLLREDLANNKEQEQLINKILDEMK